MLKNFKSNFFDKEKYENLQLYLRLQLKLKKNHCLLEFYQLQWLKPYVELNSKKRIEAEANGEKDAKALCKLMNDAMCDKTTENFENRIDGRLASNKKDYLK